MGINKVQINKDNKLEVLIDLTKDTVTEDTLLEGYTSHDKDGEQIVGKAKLGEDVTSETNTYTSELADLLTQISTLETALEGKAAGGSGGGEQTKENAKVTLTLGGKTPVQLNKLIYLFYEDGKLFTSKNSFYGGVSTPYTFQAAVGEVFCLQFTYTGNYNSSTGSGINKYIVDTENDIYLYKVVSKENATLYCYDE